MATVGARVEADDVVRAGRLGAEVVSAVETPALVIDERVVARQVAAARRLGERAGCRVLYALKPLAAPFVLDLMAGRLDGFAASSPFEAALARSVLGDSGAVHLTTPGLRPADTARLADLCDRVAFNSLAQFRRHSAHFPGPGRAGLRVNPGLSLVDDERYDPCRRASKLGVALGTLRRALRRDDGLARQLGGIHFHNNCDSEEFAPLRRTARRVEAALRPWLPGMRWVNLGGGYLFGLGSPTRALAEAVSLFRDRHGLEVFIEPGAALVRDAGALVTEVVDLFRSGGRRVAVLDTTVNHFPEAYEYRFEPDVLGHDDDGHEYVLAGASCLAGDVLGVYGFREKLRVGSRLVLPGLGAYSFVKAHMFNGINLPALYSVTAGGRAVLRRRFDYSDFLSRAGGIVDEAG
jgi:carboxynorspermidine decarboxylase